MRSWWNARSAPILQGIALVTVFLLASKDIDRTMHQRPVTQEQTQALAAFVERSRS